MSQKSTNPKAAIEALFPQDIDCGEGVTVKPFSLATYALLEKIGSYILVPHQPDPTEVLESLYICTHGAREILADSGDGWRGRLLEKAVEWAEGVPPYLLQTITAAIKTQIKRVRDVVPPPKEGELPKKARAG